jgi:hypothetical protein
MGGGGGGGIWLCGKEHIHELYTVYLTMVMQIPNLQNCFTTPNKNLGWGGPQTGKHLPPSPFTGQFLRKADI